MNKLSILIPSKRPEGLEAIIESLKKNTSDFNSIELVIAVDDEKEYLEIHDNINILHRPPNDGNVGELLHECYKIASGNWIMFGNDDIICETPGWDKTVLRQIERNDEYWFYWINDNLFKEKFACFPIVSKKAIDEIRLFPTPYKHYKIDDTIRDAFPANRQVYFSTVIFTHANRATEGFGAVIEPGLVYPMNEQWAVNDNSQWHMTQNDRINARNRIARITKTYDNIPTRILVGVPTMEFARQAMFYDFYNQLQKPEGTVCTFAHGQSPAKNRNLMIEQALINGCTHILFLDDDIAFQPDLLTKLLAHNKDIVCGLQLMRNYPHRPLIFGWADANGRCSHYYPKDGENGLIEIVACGLGAVLIKTEVFRAIEAPWVRLGELESDNWCDDIGLYKRVRDAGFKLFCDLDVKVGHMASVTIWPTNDGEAKHLVTYNTNGEGVVTFPAVRPPVPVLAS